MELKKASLLFDLSRLRHDYDSNCLLNSIRIGSQDFKFSIGFNDGRNRRELLALFPKNVRESAKEASAISLSPSSNSEENIHFDFLRSRRRQEHGGSLFLDLRGTIIEKLFNRRFNDGDLNLLFQFLETRPKICGLHLAYNNLSNRGFAKLSDFLANQSSIKYVNVMNNDITSLDKKKLAEDVSKWKVQCLNLGGNKIGRKGGETVAHLLTKNSTIRHLSLGETDQTVNSVISIADALIQFGGNQTLTKLDLTRTLLSTNAGEVCRHLAFVLKVNRSLVELVLSKNSITDLELEILIEGLKHRNVLSRLNLSSNRISSHGVELLAGVLPKTQLKLLILSTNMINDSGAMALGRVFSFTMLKFLDISMNDIGDLGITHLVWAICRPLDGFFIYGNKFTEYAAKVIHYQFLDFSLDPKTLDIRIWFDEDGNIRFARRNLWRYSEWYYYVPEWKPKAIIQHCCCPIRGGIMVQSKSDE